MAKTLVLAEKPSAAQEYAKALGLSAQKQNGYIEDERYVITWVRGHMLELADPKVYEGRYERWSYEDLPIIPEPFRYDPIPDRADQLAVIEKLAKRPDIDTVVIGTDAGREGELIARLTLEHAGVVAGSRHKMMRLWVKTLTAKGIQDAFAKLEPASVYDRLYHSALARQHSDWLIGINATRAFTSKLGALFSLGRVQTPVLAMLAKRDAEIRDFVAKDYWTLSAIFSAHGATYRGVWIGADNLPDLPEEEENAADEGDEEAQAAKDAKAEGGRFSTAAEADAVVARVQAAGQGVVAEAKCERKLENAPPLYSLTTLQRDANRILGLSADKALDVAQSLYEKKMLSYPRSEAEHLDPEMADEVRDILAKLPRVAAVSFDPGKCTVNQHNRRVFDASKLTDHHALIPTGEGGGGLSAEEQGVYDLVVRRFVGVFYPAHEYDATRIITSVGPDKFRTTGRTTRVAGWRELTGRDPEEGTKKAEEQALPPLVSGEQVGLEKTSAERRQTKAPSPYTDGALLKDMSSPLKFVTDERLKKVLKETAGLGTTATRAEVINTLLRREYIVRRGKALRVTPKGESLIRIVGGDPIADPGYTAVWEQYLDGLARGEHPSAEPFMAKIVNYTRTIVAKAGELKPLSAEEAGRKEIVLGKCPACGKDVVDRPKSYSCSGYPECRFALWKDALKHLGKNALTMSQARELLAGKQIPLKGLVSSKQNKTFDAQAKLEQHEKYGWRPALVFDDSKSGKK